MENLDFNVEHWMDKHCPPVSCKKKPCCCGLSFVNIPASLEGEFKPEKGAYSNAVVQYEGNGAVYIYTKEGIPVLVKEGNAS